MRSEFNDWYEKWTGSKVKCENTDIIGAWQHQQSKVDELQKKLDEYIFVAESIDEMYVKEVQKNNDLQKRVDEQGLIIAKVMSIASDLQKSWEMFEIGKKLEQALKGGEA